VPSFWDGQSGVDLGVELVGDLCRRCEPAQEHKQLMQVASSYRGYCYGPAARPIHGSHKIEFSFLKGNLMVPAGHPVYFNCDGSAFGNGRCLYEYRRAVLRRDIENMKEGGL
jgi:hypothetical protein